MVLFYLGRSEEAATYIATIAVGGLTAVAGTVLYVASKQKKENSIPYSHAGLLETVRGFGSPQAPFFLLKLAEEALKNPDAAVGCFKLPLPMTGGVYVVYNYQLVRKIFSDPTTDKPALYETLAPVCGTSKNIVIANNKDPHWAFARKTTRHAFSNREVGRMIDVARSILDRWEDYVGTNFISKGLPIDPAAEMAKVTFKVICEAGFEYTVSDEEYKDFSDKLERPMREFTLRQVSRESLYCLSELIHQNSET